ncbi:hypothetical protein Tco_0996357 [Tanacetum coccineum]
MNEDYYHKQNSCYDYNSFGFDPFQPPQYTVNHPISNVQNSLFNAQNEFLNSQNKLMEQMTSLCDMLVLIIAKERKKKSIKSELRKSKRAKDHFCKIPICYDDSDMTIPLQSPPGSYQPRSPLTLKVVEIVIPEVGGIDTDILLTIKDDILHEKLLNVNLLIANIEALKDNPTPSSDIVTKSSSTSLNLFLEETNTFDNSLTESLCLTLEENCSASTHSF